MTGTRVASLASALITSFFASAPGGASAQDAVLRPGFIAGTLSLGDEAIGSVQFDGRGPLGFARLRISPNEARPAYSMTVETPESGTASWGVRAQATLILAPGLVEQVFYRESTVEVSEGATTRLDFDVPEAGYIESQVNVEGDGEIERVDVTIDPTSDSSVAHLYRITKSWLADADPADRSSVSYRIPVAPGVVECRTVVRLTSAVRLTAEKQTITVQPGQTVRCDGTVTVPALGSIVGTVHYDGPAEPRRAEVGFTAGANSVTNSPETPHNYRLPNIPVGSTRGPTRVRLYFSGSDEFRFSASLHKTPRAVQTLEAGGEVRFDYYACQAYFDGIVSLSGGATPGLLDTSLVTLSAVQGGALGRSIVRRSDGRFRVYATEGDWRVTRLDLFMRRSEDDEEGFLYNAWYADHHPFESDVISLGCGESAVRTYDYPTGSLSVNFSVLDGSLLSDPSLRGECVKNDGSGQTILHLREALVASRNTPAETGVVSVVAPEGLCTFTARARVNGTQTTFGTFTVEVERGTKKDIDLGGPSLSIDSPGAQACISGNTLLVTGSATDDIGVESVVVNDVPATLSPVGGDDVKSVSFSVELPVSGTGALPLTIVATDTVGKTATDQRTVQLDAAPPVLQWSPANGTITTDSEIVVSGFADDDAGVATLLLNGELVPLSGGATPTQKTFSLPFSLVEGDNNLTLAASDVTGCNETIDMRNVVRITNRPPVVDAGPDLSVRSDVLEDTAVVGTVTDPDVDDELQCRWTSGQDVLADWIPVNDANQCPLTLGSSGLGIGEHVLTLEGSDGLESREDTVSVEIVDADLLPVEALCILATERLEISDRAHVQTGATSTTVANAGTGQTTIGSDARAPHVWSRGNVFLRNRASVQGDVRTAGSVNSQHGAAVDGSIEEGATVRFPVVSIAPSFPGNPTGSIDLQPDRFAAIEPGYFRSISVKSRSTLELAPGTYYVDNLTVEPQAVVRILDPASTRILVRQTFVHRGAFEGTQGTKDFIVAFYGRGSAQLEAPFSGTFIAESGEVNVTVARATFEGALVARRIRLAPDVSFACGGVSSSLWDISN